MLGQESHGPPRPGSRHLPSEDAGRVHVSDRMATGLRRGLSADQTESDALPKLAEACPNAVVGYETAS
ncbi:hypothetical protein [Streptomyces sp. NPDC008125]|uniref:hypothetical protein n=1 Tax=Streptomyces sp. NPDC008125 TaxID=3364811 RepID=UPI0036E2D178